MSISLDHIKRFVITLSNENPVHRLRVAGICASAAFAER